MLSCSEYLPSPPLLFSSEPSVKKLSALSGLGVRPLFLSIRNEGLESHLEERWSCGC